MWNPVFAPVARVGNAQKLKVLVVACMNCVMTSANVLNSHSPRLNFLKKKAKFLRIIKKKIEIIYFYIGRVNICLWRRQNIHCHYYD